MIGLKDDLVAAELQVKSFILLGKKNKRISVLQLKQGCDCSKQDEAAVFQQFISDIGDAILSYDIISTFVSVDSANWTFDIEVLGHITMLQAENCINVFINKTLVLQTQTVYPDSWSYEPDAEVDPCLVVLDSNSEEFKTSAVKFSTGYESKIIRIERVQNCELYREYCKVRKTVARRNEVSGGANEMLFLKHGTRQTLPSTIWNSGHKTNSYGFDFKYSKDGFFGRGAYFAEDTAYSHLYRFHIPGDKKHCQMFLAHVIAGKIEQKREKDSSIVIPTPPYNSVRGPLNATHQGIIVYELNQSYPAYLVTYEDN